MPICQYCLTMSIRRYFTCCLSLSQCEEFAFSDVQIKFAIKTCANFYSPILMFSQHVLNCAKNVWRRIPEICLNFFLSFSQHLSVCCLCETICHFLLFWCCLFLLKEKNHWSINKSTHLIRILLIVCVYLHYSSCLLHGRISAPLFLRNRLFFYVYIFVFYCGFIVLKWAFQFSAWSIELNISKCNKQTVFYLIYELRLRVCT